MANPALRARISVYADADPEELARAVRGLRDELAELDAEAVDFAAGGRAPTGAKGLGESAGALIITLSDSAVLVALAGVLRSWVSRDRGRKVRVRIGDDSVEVSAASTEEQARLIEAWLQRHAR